MQDADLGEAEFNIGETEETPPASEGDDAAVLMFDFCSPTRPQASSPTSPASPCFWR